MPPEKPRNSRSGKLVVLVIIGMGLALGLIGLKYRNAARPVRPLTQPSTGRVDLGADHREEPMFVVAHKLDLQL